MPFLNIKSVSVRSPWDNLGNITTAQSDPAVTARDAATVEALSNILTLTVPMGVYGVLLRFRTVGEEDDSNVIQIYATRNSNSKDHYMKAAQLTLLQGQQLYSTGIYFVDTVTPASEDGLLDGEESNLTNGVGQYYFRRLGNSKFVFLLSTKDASTTAVYIDFALLYESA